MTFASSIARINAACERTFGESATLNGAPVIGIYQAPYAEAFGIATADPTFKTRTLNLPAEPVTGKALTVPGVGDFRVRAHQPDGTGWSTLLLESA